MTRSQNRPAAEAIEIAKTVAGGLAIALVLRVALFQPFTVPSGSMEPGLLVGDYLVVSKFDYGWSRHSLPMSPPIFGGRLFKHGPRRGEIVVFRKPDGGREDVIKRVIGLPGDRIQVRQGAVWINGAPIARRPLPPSLDPAAPDFGVTRAGESVGGHSYVTLDRGPAHPGDDTGVYLVPEGSFFVMGDNRDNSADSRWPPGQGMGFVPAENLIGRARLVLASWKAGASVLKPWTWLNLRGGRFLRVLS